MSAQPVFESVDNYTGSLLDLIAEDWTPFAQADMNTIAAAIRLDAETHDGQIHPNRVRRDLAGRVKPQRVGITYRAMCLAGLIRVDGWDVNDGTGVERSNSGNAGKPARCYTWIGDGAECRACRIQACEVEGNTATPHTCSLGAAA